MWLISFAPTLRALLKSVFIAAALVSLAINAYLLPIAFRFPFTDLEHRLAASAATSAYQSCRVQLEHSIRRTRRLRWEAKEAARALAAAPTKKP